MQKLYKNKDWLNDQYYILNKSQSQIAKECNVSQTTIYNWMKKFNIQKRTILRKYNNKKWLYEQYITKERSSNEIAEECNVSKITIFNKLNLFKINIRNYSEAGKLSFEKGRSISHGFGRYAPSGEKHHNWKGVNGSDSAKRSYMIDHYNKSEFCKFCGKGNCKISFSFDHYKGAHTREIDDYKELCDKCHFNRDFYEFGIHKGSKKNKEFKLICENGVNFRDLEEAKEMIKKAKEIGAFGSKFQIYSNKEIKGHKHERFLDSIMLDQDSIKELYEYGKKIDQNVIFTCMNEESIEWCLSLNIKYCKIRYLDQNNYSLLWKAFLSGINFFISTDYFIPFRTNFSPLFCVPKYPASFEDYQIPNNVFYQGISDHTSNLKLLKKTIKEKRLIYFETHVKLEGTTPIESKWSKSFIQLKEALEP